MHARKHTCMHEDTHQRHSPTEVPHQSLGGPSAEGRLWQSIGLSQYVLCPASTVLQRQHSQHSSTTPPPARHRTPLAQHSSMTPPPARHHTPLTQSHLHCQHAIARRLASWRYMNSFQPFQLCCRCGEAGRLGGVCVCVCVLCACVCACVCATLMHAYVGLLPLAFQLDFSYPPILPQPQRSIQYCLSRATLLEVERCTAAQGCNQAKAQGQQKPVAGKKKAQHIEPLVHRPESPSAERPT